MRHSYFTGVGLGARVAYDSFGGTDSLAVGVDSSLGTYTAISSSSSYGPVAVQIDTTATATDICALRTYVPSGQTERRVSVVIDMPTLASGQFIAPVSEGNTGGNFYIYLYRNGSWAAVCNGVAQYTSAAGVLPAAGTMIRISYALAINGTSSTWRANIYTDATNTPVGAERSGTTSWSGTFWNMGYVGKTLGQSTTSTSLLIRAIRVENGGGCGAALLPQESQLTPASGGNVVPIRLVSFIGTAPAPAGALAITNLADGDNATTVSMATGSTVRVAMRPMAPVGPYLTFNLYQAALSTAGTIGVRLWKGNDGLQIGSTKNVAVNVAAADATVTFSAGELSGITSADWESLELEISVP